MNTVSFLSLTRQPFRVGPWQVVPSQQHMLRGNQKRTLDAPHLLLLRYLAVQEETATPPATLLEVLREQQVQITPAALPALVASLHQALHLTDTDPWIETTSDGHYRLVADIAFYDHVSRHATQQTSFKLKGQKRRFHRVGEQAYSESRQEAARVGRRRKRIVGAGILVAALVLLLLFRANNQPPVVFEAPPSTDFPGYETDGALSPDGNHLAFAHQQNPQHNAQLLLKSLTNNEQQQTQPLTNNEQHHRNPTWSPDGKQLAFLRFPNTQSNSCHIVLLDLDARTEQTLAPCGEKPVPDLAWSPDGTTLVFSAVTVAGAPSQLVALTVATGERRGLTEPPGGILGDTDPSFSPDGRWLAFTRQVHPQDNDLFLMPVTADSIHRLTYHEQPIRGHTWMRDGNHLLFAFRDQARYELWQLRLDGSRSRPFPLDDVETTYPRLAYGSARLVYLRQPTRSRIWQVALDGSDSVPTLLLPDVANAQQPAFSPVDDRFLFLTSPSRRQELWLFSPEQEQATPIATAPDLRVTLARWSPDGSQVVYIGRKEGQYDLFLIPATGGTPQALTASLRGEIAPSWSSDGREIYYSSRRRISTWEIWRIPAAPGFEEEEERVTFNGGRVSFADATGTWLYYTKFEETGLWRRNLAKGFEEQVLTTLDPADSGNWVLTRQGIYFVQRLPDGTTPVLFFDLASETTTTVFTPPQPLPTHTSSISVSHDQRYLLFTQTDLAESDLIILDVD